MAMAKDGYGTFHGYGVGVVARRFLILSQSLTLVGFLLILGPLSKIQQIANGLNLPEAVQLVYTDVFQSGGQVPYPEPGQGKNQFALQWYLLFLELVVFIVVVILTTFPRNLLRFKITLVAFLTYMMALLTLQIQSLTYFHRNAAANQVYGSTNIEVLLAGVIVVVLANGFTLLTLGLIHHDNIPGGAAAYPNGNPSFARDPAHKNVHEEPAAGGAAAV